MIVSFSPADRLEGDIFLPASKSYSIRAFLIAACGGRSSLVHPSNCDDARVAMRVARALGAQLHKTDKNTWQVIAATTKTRSTINVGESGTVLRFLLPLLSLKGQHVVVTGEGTLRGRPNWPLTGLLRQQGVDVRGTGKVESVPICFCGGKMRAGQMNIDGGLSSQFISALLIACPQLLEDTHLTVRGRKLVSGDYIQMTREVLSVAKVRIKMRGQREFFISGRQRFRGLGRFIVPSDFGLAAFHLAAAALCPSRVTLRGQLAPQFIQADERILGILRRMGVRFQKTDRFLKMTGPFSLRGGDFDLASAPDLVPILSVLALFARGRTRIYNIGHARVKESDRISDLRRELLKVGAKIKESQDQILIEPQPKYRQDVVLDPHHDHRLAMAFAVLGVKLGVRIKDMSCVAKSYPDFLKDFRSLGVRFRKI